MGRGVMDRVAIVGLTVVVAVYATCSGEVMTGAAASIGVVRHRLIRT